MDALPSNLLCWQKTLPWRLLHQLLIRHATKLRSKAEGETQKSLPASCGTYDRLLWELHPGRTLLRAQCAGSAHISGLTRAQPLRGRLGLRGSTSWNLARECAGNPDLRAAPGTASGTAPSGRLKARKRRSSAAHQRQSPRYTFSEAHR
jgi:hypothetical protein